MAGNTKLRGFGGDGKVVLSRWGKDAHVEVSQDSLAALRNACFEVLPKKPKKQHFALKNPQVEYDEHYGLVSIRLTPEWALRLAEAIEGDDASFAEDLHIAHQDHIDYHETSSEPGGAVE